MLPLSSAQSTCYKITVFLLGLFIFSYANALTKDEKLMLLASRKPTHYLSQNNKNGCKTCHSTMGYTGGEEEQLCYTCHGSEMERVSAKVQKSKLRPVAASDIKSDFQKPYRHPVEKYGLYNPLEKFPIIDPKAPRHAECLDCHNPHYSIPEMPYIGATGISIDGKFKQYAEEEYEVCFKCHGQSNNKPIYQKDKIKEFSPKNPSFHPVVEAGKNNYLPSLTKDMNFDTIIKCSSCHGADERTNKGKAGVHGSENEYILVLPYTKIEETMIPRYDLCYKCHRKESILDNQSFRYHREHIEGVKSRNWKGTSCSTCHNPHGSTKYKFLIEFNTDYVQKDIVTNKIEFISEGVFSGVCYLRCHNVDHSPKRYGSAIR